MTDSTSTAERNLAILFGPLQWQQTGLSRREAHVSYRGHHLVVRRTRAEERGVWGTLVQVPLARPVALDLNPAGPGRHATFLPAITTGDARFDEVFRTSGSPPGVMQAALDPELRRRLLATRIAPGTADGRFHLSVSQDIEGSERKANMAGQRILGWIGEGDPDAARRRIDLFLDVLTVVQHRFDERFRQVEATQGRPAAEAWYREQEAALVGASRRRGLVIAAILVAVLTVFVLIPVLALI